MKIFNKILTITLLALTFCWPVYAEEIVTYEANYKEENKTNAMENFDSGLKTDI